MSKVLAAVVLASALAVPADDSKPKTKIRLGAISVGAGYAHHSGPYYGYPYYPYYRPAWMPWLWDAYWTPAYMHPFYHPAYYTGFARGADKGEVRLVAEPKHAEVYLDGAYAGTAGDLRSMWLNPGAYNLEVRAAGREKFEKRIYVLTGKTLKLEATP